MGIRTVALSMALTVSIGVCSVGVAMSPAAAGAPRSLTVGTFSTSSGTVDDGSAYDYTPSVMQDGLYRMWWCGSDAAHPADHILYAESTSLDGPFHARANPADPYNVVFGPSSGSTFDSAQTCDPSVIRVGSYYYMYYGAAGASPVPGYSTSIGLATSSDGLTWTRANRGRPIIVPANKQNTGNAYGAGQPSVSYRDGYFYLMYTDTSGAASAGNGSGQYILRSTDPTFGTGVQELTALGFRGRNRTNHTQYRVTGPWFSVDMQFSDALNSWVVAHSDGHTSYLSFFAADWSRQNYTQITMPLYVVEGPGIVSRPDKHSVPPDDGSCGTVSIDLINATQYVNGSTNRPMALKREGVQVSAGGTCATMTAARVAGIYTGYALQVSGELLAYIVGGRRLESASAPPIQDVTKNFVSTTTDVYDQIPYGATLNIGADSIVAPGRPVAFLLDGPSKWPMNSSAILIDNLSPPPTNVSTTEYDGYPTGAALYAVQ